MNEWMTFWARKDNLDTFILQVEKQRPRETKDLPTVSQLKQWAGFPVPMSEVIYKKTLRLSPFYRGKHMQVLILSRSSCPRYLCADECIYLFIPYAALKRTGGSLPTAAPVNAVFSKLKNKTWRKNNLFRRRGNNTSPRTSFLGQSRKAPAERAVSVIKLPKLVTKRNRADVEDFNFAEGFGTMSQGTEFAKFLRKNSVTWNENLAGPQWWQPDPPSDVVVIDTNLLLLLICKGRQMGP